MDAPIVARSDETEATSTDRSLAEPGRPAEHAAGRRWRDVVAHPLLWLVSGWVGLNLWWLWANRRSRVFEIDEAGYAAMAARLSRQGTPKGIWAVFHEGNHGPLQAILATPPQWLLGSDPATLLWENVLFGAGTAVAAYVMTRQLATRGAGLVSAAVVLLNPGIIEHSRVALTVMPAVLFATVAMAALVSGRGLERGRWALVAGAAVGCMTLSRTMTIGFVPVIGVAALGWVVSRRTPLRMAARNGALAVAAALVVALWWWVMRWADVSEYLFGGGSADTVQNHDLLAKARVHTVDLQRYLGRTTVVVGLVCFVALRLLVLVPAVRQRLGRGGGAGVDAPDAPDAPDAGGDAPLALWPLLAASVAGLAVLTSGTAFGVGFTLPLLPWVVTFAVAGARRTLGGLPWRIWATLVTVVALITAVTLQHTGVSSRLIWCSHDAPKSNCAVDTDAEGRQWHHAVAQISDRIWTARSALDDPAELRVALLTRDLLLNQNTLALDLELRRSTGIALYLYFQPGLTIPEQLQAMVDEADLLVAAEDYRPGEVILGTFQPDPQAAVQAALAGGFTPCDEIALPDGRSVTVLAAPDTPPAACDP